MGVAILVRKCEGCMNSGFAWFDLARLQDWQAIVQDRKNTIILPEYLYT